MMKNLLWTLVVAVALLTTAVLAPAPAAAQDGEQQVLVVQFAAQNLFEEPVRFWVAPEPFNIRFWGVSIPTENLVTINWMLYLTPDLEFQIWTEDGSLFGGQEVFSWKP